MFKQSEKKHKLTQAQLGEILHISRGAIGTYERGASLPEITTLKSMCEYFHVTLEYLLDFSDQRTYEIGNEEILKLFYTLPEDKRTNFSELLEAYVFWINNKDKKEP